MPSSSNPKLAQISAAYAGLPDEDRSAFEDACAVIRSGAFVPDTFATVETIVGPIAHRVLGASTGLSIREIRELVRSGDDDAEACFLDLVGAVATRVRAQRAEHALRAGLAAHRVQRAAPTFHRTTRVRGRSREARCGTQRTAGSRRSRVSASRHGPSDEPGESEPPRSAPGRHLHHLEPLLSGAGHLVQRTSSRLRAGCRAAANHGARPVRATSIRKVAR